MISPLEKTHCLAYASSHYDEGHANEDENGHGCVHLHAHGQGYVHDHAHDDRDDDHDDDHDDHDDDDGDDLSLMVNHVIEMKKAYESRHKDQKGDVRRHEVVLLDYCSSDDDHVHDDEMVVNEYDYDY